ncbi:MAG: hypothetical protein RR182_07610 [Alistipes sp.]
MKNNIDEAIYAMSSDIMCHRYNPMLGIILTLVGIGSLWANVHLQFFVSHEILSQWNLLIGSCVLCTGIIMICYRFFGDSSCPIEKTTKERLYRTELCFDGSELNKVKRAVETGDFAFLLKLPKSYHPAAQVIYYRTDSGSMLAAQVLQYQTPATDVKVFHSGEYVL